jgi:hypothetical protein
MFPAGAGNTAAFAATIREKGGRLAFASQHIMNRITVSSSTTLTIWEKSIQFYSCFISYYFEDEEFARRLHRRMRDAHLRVWFAPEDIQGGKKLHEQIETAIRVYDKLLIVLSEASLQSEWVMDELRKGFKAERDTGKCKLFPVRLTDYETLERWVCRDSLSGKDLAEEVRQYFIPDFSHWKEHDEFEAAFARLLEDLKTDVFRSAERIKLRRRTPTYPPARRKSGRV